MQLFQRLRAGQRAATWTYRFADPATGRPRTVTTPFTTRADALAQAEADLLTRQRGLAAEADRLFHQRRRGTVQPLLEHYLTSGCPDRHKQPRSPNAQTTEQTHCATLAKWWGPRVAASLTDADQDDYHTWRLSTVTRGTGHRAAELELNTLRNALAWAVRTRRLDRFPFTKIYKFRQPKSIAHARDYMPADAAELHRLIAWLLRTPGLEARGWQVALQAFTGLREGETRLLLARPPRPDPLQPAPPGHISSTVSTVSTTSTASTTHDYLHVTRLKNGRYPRIRLDDPDRPEIRPLLDRILQWKTTHHPDSPWLLPNRHGAQLGADGLSKALARATKALGLPERHGHSLRAYYATARLAQGIPPEDIAKELGQSSGDDLVRDIYGIEPDDFELDTWRAFAHRYTWLPADPTTQPGWTTLTPCTNIIAL